MLPVTPVTESCVDPRVARALRFLITHFADGTVQLADVAAFAGAAPATLVKGFRTQFKISPMRLLLMIRMDMADELLTRTDRAVSSIAVAVGIPNFFSTFARNSRRVYGVECPQARITRNGWDGEGATICYGRPFAPGI